jgi:TetR/AcrR family transcriptional repressor of nem operon
MPWPANHKAATRQRIIEAAAAAFRAGGIEGVRVEDVMAAAGLTRGGFYAHFESKDELLRESLKRASAETIERLSTASSAPQDDGVMAMIEAYLSPGHVAHPEHGCPLAALGPEIARGAADPRRALAAGVKDRLRWMRQLSVGRGARPPSDEEAIGTLACMVGAVILARTLGASDSARVLRACRAFLRRALDRPAAAPRPRHRSARRRTRQPAPSR